MVFPLEVLDLFVEPFRFLLRRGGPLARLVVAHHQLWQETEDLACLFDPLRDSLSRFSGGCWVHDPPRLLRGAFRLRRGRRGDGGLPAVGYDTWNINLTTA